MTTENIDVVVKSSGTKRVVRDLDEIGDAALRADNRVQAMMRQLQGVSSAASLNSLNKLQTTLSMLGKNNHLTGLVQQLQQVTQQVQQLAHHTQRAGSHFGGFAAGSIRDMLSLRTVINTVISALGIRQIMQWADAWIEAAGKIRVFTSSQEEANIVMERLFAVAQTVRQPISSLANLYNRLTIAGKELGVSQNQMIGFTELIGKALAIQGTSGQQARGVMLQLSQAMGEGIVRGQEYNSMMENLPLVLNIVAKNLAAAEGSTAKLRRIMLQGKLTSRDFFTALMKGQDELNQLFQNAPKTFSQGWTIIVNAIERYLGKLNEAYGVSQKFHTLANLIAGNLETMGKLLPVIAVGMAAAFAPTGIAALNAGLALLTPKLLAIGAMLLTNPFAVLAVAAVAAYQFGDAVNIGLDSVTTLRDLMDALGPILVSVFKQAWEWQQKFLGDMLDAAKSVYGALGALVQTALEGMGKSYSQFYEDTGTGFAGVAMKLAKTADAIGGLLLGMGIGIVRVLEGLPEAVDQIGRQMYNFLIGHVEEMINKTIAGVNRIRGLVGADALSLVQFERASVDEKYFQQYGQRIAGAVDEGFEMQGNFLQTKLQNLFNDARRIAATRTGEAGFVGSGSLDRPLGSGREPKVDDKKGAGIAARGIAGELREELDRYKVDAAQIEEITRHKTQMLEAEYGQGLINYKEYNTQLAQLQNEGYERQKGLLEAEKTVVQQKLEELQAALRGKGANATQIANVVKDLTTRLVELDDRLGKLQNKNQERLADSLAKALGPARELAENAEKSLKSAEENTEQQLRRVGAQKNINKLSERDLYIHQELLKLTNKYEDEIVKIQASRQQMIDDGVFDKMDDPAVAKAWKDINDALAKWEDALGRIKKEAPAALAAAFDAQKVNEMASRLSDAISEGLAEGGATGAKRIRDAILDELRKPFVTYIKGVIQPFVNQVSQMLYNGTGAGGMNVGAINAGGGGGLFQQLGGLFNGGGGLSSVFDKVSGWFSGTPINPATTAMTNGAFLGEGVSSGVGAWDAAAGMGGMASALPYVGALFSAAQGNYGQAAGMAIGTAIMPGVGTIVGSVLGSLIDGMGSKGGPKIEGYYNPYNTDPWSTRNDAQAAASSKEMALGVQTVFDSVLKNLGATSNQKFGVGFITDPQGDAPSMATVGVGAEGKESFKLYRDDIGRSEEELQAALTEMTSRAMLKAWQDAKIEGPLGDYLKKLGDVMTLTADTVKTATEKIQKASNEKAALDERIYQLTATADEKLLRQRQMEMDAIDATNEALLRRVWQLEDETAAANDLAAALGNAAQQQAEYKNFIQGSNADIRQFIDSLNVGAGSMLSPKKQLQNAESQFNRQFELAKNGDRGARQSLTQYAQTLIEEQTDYSASSPATRARIDQIIKMLESLPDMETSEEYLARIMQEETDKANTVRREIGDKIFNGLWGSAGFLSREFRDIDANSDGKLSFEEMKLLLGPIASDKTIRQLMRRADANGDGMLTKQEITNARVQSVVDVIKEQTKDIINHDKKLVDKEMTTWQKWMQYVDSGGKKGEVPPWYSPSTGSGSAGGESSVGTTSPWASTVNGYASGGMHAGGWRMVGETGWELETTGPARYYSHDDSVNMLRSAVGANDDAIYALAEKVDNLTRVVAVGLQRTAEATEETAANTKTNETAALLNKVRK